MSVAWRQEGPSVCAFLPEAEFTGPRVRAALLNLYDYFRTYPDANQLRIADQIRTKSLWSFSYRWYEIPPEGVWVKPGMQTTVTVNTFSIAIPERGLVAPRGAPQFQWAGHRYISAMARKVELPYAEWEKVGYVLERYYRFARALQPAFGFVDDFGSNIFRPDRRETDLRRFGWGAAIYGPQLVARIGEERIRTAPAWRVERFDWGGYWVQAEENPFQASTRAKTTIAEHLQLADMFNDEHGPIQLAPKPLTGPRSL